MIEASHRAVRTVTMPDAHPSRSSAGSLVQSLDRGQARVSAATSWVFTPLCVRFVSARSSTSDPTPVQSQHQSRMTDWSAHARCETGGSRKSRSALRGRRVSTRAPAAVLESAAPLDSGLPFAYAWPPPVDHDHRPKTLGHDTATQLVTRDRSMISGAMAPVSHMTAALS